MSSTLTVLRDEVKSRLMIDASQATPEPTNTQIEDWLRLSFAELIAILPLVQHTTVSVGVDEDITLTTDRAFFVAINGRILFDHQWNREGSTIQLVPHTAEAGDLAAVWYSAPVAITIGSTTSIDSSCIFGEDWLEEPAIQRAVMHVMEHKGGIADSSSGGDYASWYRVKQDEYRDCVQQRKVVWDQWLGSMNQKIASRDRHGPKPVSYSPYGGIRNAMRRVTVWEG